jgi:GntR family transcriptional regulator
MSKSVHISIRDDLRSRLLAGEWGAGGKLPSEAELAATYGVARMTIRQAIAALALEGAVVRRQGLGTFALDQRPMGRTRRPFGFPAEMRLQGHQVTAKLIRAAVEQPPSAAHDALQLRPSASSVLVRRARLVDDCPIIVESSWLSNARFAGLAADPLLDGSLYAMLEKHYGVSIVRVTQVFTVGVAAQPDATELDLQVGAPVLLVTRTAYDTTGRPVEYAISVARTAYLVETFMEGSQQTAQAEPQRSRPHAPKRTRSEG